MINRMEFSNRCHDIVWNIGDLEQPHIQRQLLLLIGSRFTAKVVLDPSTNLWMLQTSMPIKEIPIFVEDLTNRQFNIYEIRLA